MAESRRSFALEDEEEHIHVVVRIRPMQTNEKKNGDIPCVKAMSSGREVQVKVGPLEAQNYKCHRCFDPDASQPNFFEDCGITDLLDSSIEGYRSCAFAFGQTGAGKTYTMVGASKGLNAKDKHVGLIGRSLEYLYSKLSASEQPFRIKLSCLEIYHEHIYDLFAEEKDRTPLAIREHATEGFFMEGSRLVECKDYDIACSALDVAVKNRQVGGHELNSRSSRSHCVTEIHIEVVNKYHQGNIENDQIYKEMGVDEKAQYTTKGKMSLIDLAGSERLKNTNSTGKVLQEAGFINRSLYVLGKVIAGLVRTNGDLNHKDVPYRDSKLTKLLISSLGGNSRTLLIACVSEAKGSQAETLRTLKFSMSCARIRNKPVKFLDPQEKLIKELRDEIKRLKLENRKLRSTLLTAPTGDKSSYLSPGSNTSDEFHRALSAQPNMRPVPSSNSPIKKKQNLISNQKNSKKKQYSTRMKESKSDIFAKYPQLKNILKDEKKKQLINEDHRFRPSVHDSLESITKSKKGNIAVEDKEIDQEDSPSRKISNEILDEMVHRRAPGPMIFKDKSPIPPLRDTRLKQYYPAENYVKSMDAKFEKDQKDTISRDLLDVMDESRLDSAPPQEHEMNLKVPSFPLEDNSSIHSSNISIDASEIIKKKQKKTKAPVKNPPKPTKPSPYIAHLYQKGKGKAGETKDEKKTIKSVSQLPNLPKSKVIQAKLPKDDKEPTHDQSSIYPVNPRESDLHDSIMKELDELGLSPTKNPPTSSSVKKLPNINKSSASVYKTAIGSPKKPPSRSNASPKKNKLPNISNSSNTQGNKISPTKQQLSSAMFHHTKDREEEPELEIQFDSNFLPESFDKAIPDIEVPKPLGDFNEAPSPEKLREKLAILEKSLRTKRMEMEDCPGDVTSDMEERFRELQVQTKMLKLELTKLTGEVYIEDQDVYSPINKKKVISSPHKISANENDDYGDEYGEDDFEDDFEPQDDEPLNQSQPEEDNKPVEITQVPEIDAPELKKADFDNTVEEDDQKKYLFLQEDQPKPVTPPKEEIQFDEEPISAKKIEEKTSPVKVKSPIAQKEDEQTYEDDNYEEEFEDESRATSPMKAVQEIVDSPPVLSPPQNAEKDNTTSTPGKYQEREITISPSKNPKEQSSSSPSPSVKESIKIESPTSPPTSKPVENQKTVSPSRLPPAPTVIQDQSEHANDDFEAEYGDDEFYEFDD